MHNTDNSISLASWNINGLFQRPAKNIRECKMSNDHFKQFIVDHSVVAISETRIGQPDNVKSLEIEHFHCYPKCRQKSTNGIYYGGMCLYVKNSVKKGVTVIDPDNSVERYWVKIDESVFKNKYDLHVCFTYVRPNDTTGKYGIDMLEIIEKEIGTYCKLGRCLVVGDLNGHTNTDHDHIINDSLDMHESRLLNLPTGCTCDRNQWLRKNCDKSPVNPPR